MSPLRFMFALLCLFPPALLRPLAATPASAEATDLQSDDPAYVAGTKALNESRWSDAVASFDRVIQARGSRAEAALYWKAYALNKLGKPDLALAICVQLRTQVPASSWNRDCAALKFNLTATSSGSAHSIQELQDGIDQAMTTTSVSDSHSHAHDPNADLKILALNSLLHREPTQALPILVSLLKGDQTPDVKRHALFILAQSRSPEAEATMRDLLLGKMGPDLQRNAMQAAGVYEGRRLNDTLVEVYRSTPDPKIKQSVISAFFVSNDDVHLVDLARAEKNMDLKRSIVSQLSLMNGKAATDYMMELLK